MRGHKPNCSMITWFLLSAQCLAIQANTAVAENALEFKTLADAMRIRNHVIDLFERADSEPDPERRRALLTFVVAGGGFSGAELAGGLNDFARGIIADYPNLSTNDLRIVLVHSGERILPELSKSLADYAMERMRERGVTFKLNTRVVDAGPGSITLSSTEEIPTETFVWAAGARPNRSFKSCQLNTVAEPRCWSTGHWRYQITGMFG